MSVISFVKAAFAKGFILFNQFPPPTATYKKNFDEPFFFFSCDDIQYDTKKEDVLELAKILDLSKTKGTFFVIPKCKGKEISADLAKSLSVILKNHEIAQHGITHEEKELTREPLAEITEKIKKEKFFLEKKLGRKLVGYRSPNFAWKRGAERAIKKAGFEYISESYFFNPWPYRTKENLWCVPVESKGDVLENFGFEEKVIMDFMEKKIKEMKTKKKPYVFLFHIHNFQRGADIIKKILAEAKSNGMRTDLSLGDFIEELNK